MATKKTQAEQTTKAAAQTKTETKYSLTALGRTPRKLFGVSPTVFAGATSTLDPKGKYSISEVKEIISTWLKKEAN